MPTQQFLSTLHRHFSLLVVPFLADKILYDESMHPDQVFEHKANISTCLNTTFCKLLIHLASGEKALVRLEQGYDLARL